MFVLPESTDLTLVSLICKQAAATGRFLRSDSTCWSRLPVGMTAPSICLSSRA
jgi:hypothetical protein